MYDRRDWQAWERIQKQAQQQWESCKAGNLGANSVDSEMGERIDLTIDSGCAACALPVGVASAGMQELNRATRENIAANAEKIPELGFKTPTLKFQNGDVQNLKISVMDKLHKPLVAACKVVAAGNRIVLQPENQGGSFIEDVRSKRRKRIYERNGVYVLPCWLARAPSGHRQVSRPPVHPGISTPLTVLRTIAPPGTKPAFDRARKVFGEANTPHLPTGRQP